LITIADPEAYRDRDRHQYRDQHRHRQLNRHRHPDRHRRNPDRCHDRGRDRRPRRCQLVVWIAVGAVVGVVLVIEDDAER
jgi:hypothetical protein